MKRSKTKAAIIIAGWGLLGLIGWFAMMALYFEVYNVLEDRAVPVGLSPREFRAEQWNDGFFHAKGSYENESAIDGGDELPLQSEKITCVKSTGTCTIASADIFDQYLNLDVEYYDITTWTDRQITFDDDSAICVTNSFVIDRAAESVTLIVRKKAVIPDYALKSPLHPCDNITDKNISLADGFKVYWHKRTNYEVCNSLYFHTALVVINVAYFALLFWLWKWRRDGAIAAQTVAE